MPLTRRGFLGRVGASGAVLAAGTLSGCAGGMTAGRSLPKVRVGSKPFAEQEVLGYLAHERLLGADGVRVVDEIGYGNTLQNWRAVRAGEKHLYWEYTGTAWGRIPPRRQERVTDPDRLYELVREDAAARGVRMAPPADFSNEWVLFADADWSARTGVETIGDLAAHVNAGNTDFGVAIGEDFYHWRDVWPGLTDYYGFDPEQLSALESGNFVVTSIGLTYELLAAGRVSVGTGFATDPQLDRPSFVVLDDDREYFLPYEPCPTAHAPTADRHPELLERLSPVVAELDESTIRELNRAVLVDGGDPRTVARSFLERIGVEP